MGQAKPWQIVLFVVAAVAFSVSLYFSVLQGSGLKLDSSITMADVSTGEVYHLPIGKGVNGATIPGRNPKTGEMTLLPIVKENGKWVLMERYASGLKFIPGPHAAVDEKSREVQVKGM